MKQLGDALMYVGKDLPGCSYLNLAARYVRIFECEDAYVFTYT